MTTLFKYQNIWQFRSQYIHILLLYLNIQNVYIEYMDCRFGSMYRLYRFLLRNSIKEISNCFYFYGFAFLFIHNCFGIKCLV